MQGFLQDQDIVSEDKELKKKIQNQMETICQLTRS